MCRVTQYYISCHHRQIASVQEEMKMVKTLVGFAVCMALCHAVFVQASTANTSPNIIPRSQWGARSPTSITNLKHNPAPYVIIHHSASLGCDTQAICQARMRSFQDYHMNTKKWTDIGYHFLIGGDGNVYEGRGWDIHGSHSVAYNSKSIGICFVGNFEDTAPNSAAVQAAQSLIAYGVANGKIKSDYKLLGHRQTASTLCPGNSLYKLIKTWPHWVERHS